ncbi:hydantoinase/oxoprolinase family protein [Glaciimonas sp. PCH181]|uniref:hydantoinase/oxoprolinase family protein n=1 Tax=Glaciimonas sp. PCH181 TaxID=2133943 RepID=UPI000D3C1EB1|nr:hydantoinase/oxoprolinase family protein [Glaciimonas sp. PCH181]PUA18421.1 hydantoinase [Glaciimonas sp. PCH181]
MATNIRYRAGVDIGGTFTDIVLLGTDGSIHTKKLSSTPDDYGRAIVTGLTSLLASLGATTAQVDELVHATTIATNTVLEAKGAKTALITTKGFRDVVEIGRLRVPGLYDLNYAKPTPLALRRHRYEVTERVSSNGDVVTPLDLSSLDYAIENIKTEGIEAVAVSLLHSYANPQHEQLIRERLVKEFGDAVYVTCSNEILPEIREYERTSTTVVNAYLGPVVCGYLRSLIAKLRDAGMNGAVQIMHSNGGVMTADAVMVKPAAIIESGPAAGVIAGAHVAAISGYLEVITVDMGGTTAKAAIIEGGEPARTTEYEVGAGINLSSKLVKGGGHAVKLPFVDVSEIGAGGGSKVRMDVGGLIRVGPDSAGSVPGPVCYDMGGDIPTLTDAVLTLGYLNPEYIAGGEVRLNAKKAITAIEETIAKPGNLDLLDAAFGVFSIAAASMTRAVKAVSTYRGRDPRDFALFAFGGNGPVISHAIAELMEMDTLIIPPRPGVFSAMGLLYSKTQHEHMRTLFKPLSEIADGELENALLGLARKASGDLIAEGYSENDIALTYALDIRYAEQAYELSVPLSFNGKEKIDLEKVALDFHAEHRRTYGHASEHEPVELVTVRLSGGLKLQENRRYEAEKLESGDQVESARASKTRKAYFGKKHGLIDTPVLTRKELLGRQIVGPAIIEEYDSTCVIPPGATARIDNHQNIHIQMGVAK